VPFESVVAALLGEPFHLTLGDIAKLTDWQIRELYFHARDEAGKVKPKHSIEALTGVPDGPLSDEQKRHVLYAAGAAMGLPRAELDRAWADYEKRKADGQGEGR
jgi:hypothetical protein